MKSLLFFSHNNKKVYEVEKILKRKDIKILNLNFYDKIKEPIENGNSFADDSGICIEALNNKPGIKSKRFLENFKTHRKAFEYIISSVVNKKNDKAFFKTAICLSIKKNHHIVFEGKVNGRISKKPKGINGFGYDPIFIPDGYKKTFAEMSSKEKNTISHRLIALRKMESFLFN